MPLTHLAIEDFSAFGKAELELASGVNVFIGENATGKTHAGKTHAMKAIYAGLRAHGEEGSALSHGSLREQGVLLWDEPEANLNPRLVVLVADVLVSLAAIGVQNLELRFSDEARVLHWDADDAYKRGRRRCQGTKAVDFCLLSGGGMAVEVAEKVRDSLAGMTWACERKLSAFEDFERFVHCFINRSSKLEIVLWLEQDRSPDVGFADALRSAIDSRLRAWLNAHIIVTSRRLEQQTTYPLEWLDVHGRS